MPADSRYAIVGTGNIGSALATLFGRAGVEVRIANTRGPDTISELAASAGPSVLPASLVGALACEVIFMAIPFTAVEQFARELPDWTLGLSAVELGKIAEGGRLIQAPNALVLRNLTELPLT